MLAPYFGGPYLLAIVLKSSQRLNERYGDVSTVMPDSSADWRLTIRDDSIGDFSRQVLRSAILGRPFGLVRAVDSHSEDGIEKRSR